ncbi:L,D-transpeptidase [Corynebacterium variabile]|uniref:L,D-transpeptidase n=1 Tax=Corynebacterium variabile TaxID=1727 RepID=UPI003FD3D507
MKFMRTILTAFGILVAGSLAITPTANAQTGPAPAMPSVPSSSDLQGMAGDALSDAQSAVNGAVADALGYLPDIPGVSPAPAPAPAPSPAPQPAPRPSTGCSAQAKACINLTNQTAWLQSDGVITRGPVPMSSGRAGYETPAGLTRVTRKIIDEWSNAWDAPMPYSVYFSAGTAYPGDIGIAFHEGSPAVMSHGCIHLNHEDAVAFFNTLQVGDYVDVVA